MAWPEHRSDIIFFLYIHLNFSKRFRNLKSGPNLTRFEIESDIPRSLSKKMIFSQVAILCDPLKKSNVSFHSRSKISHVGCNCK